MKLFKKYVISFVLHCHTQCVFYTHSTCQFRPTATQGLNSQVWPVAVALDIIVLIHSQCHCTENWPPSQTVNTIRKHGWRIMVYRHVLSLQYVQMFWDSGCLLT